MKRLLISGLVFLAGCATNISTIKSKEQILWEQIADCVKSTKEFLYVPEPEGMDEWQTPEEFKITKRGDCEDFANYLYDLLESHGINSRRALGYSIKERMNQVPDIRHIWNEVVIGREEYLIDSSTNPKIFMRKSMIPKDKYIETGFDEYFSFKLALMNLRRSFNNSVFYLPEDEKK